MYWTSCPNSLEFHVAHLMMDNMMQLVGELIES